MTKNHFYPLLTESPGKVCGSYFNVASGQTTHITMCSFSTPFKVIEKTYWGRVALVVDTKTITQTHRSIHKHIEVYTNTTQPMHITMCSFWTPFKVIEKTQKHTVTNKYTNVFLVGLPPQAPLDQICVSDPSSHGRKRSHWRLPHPCYRSWPLRK